MRLPPPHAKPSIDLLWRNVALLSRKNGSFLRKQEVRLRNKVQVSFKKQLNWILKEMKGLFAENNFMFDVNGIEDDIDSMLDDMPEREEIAVSIVTSSSPAMDKGGKTIVSDLKLGDFGISWSLANEKAIQYLEDRKSLELSNNKGNIADTTKSRILQILVDAAKTGQSYQKTAELIQEQAVEGVFTQARAEMIATREIGVAYEEGKAIPLKEFKDDNPERGVEKFWQTVEDSKVTETHRENEKAGWIDFDETFPGTGDLNAPGSDNPNCRCFTKYRVKPPAK